MPIVKAFLYSVAFHILLFILMALFPHDLNLQQPEVTEIEILNPAKSATPKDRQIVRQALTPEQLKAQEDENLARFLSEQRQRVKKESQSANKGMTQNNQPGQKAEQTSPKPPSEKSGKRDLAKEGFEAWNPGGPPLPRDNGQGPSSTGESLPQDVSVGSFTALNTDRFTYYTFYARIEEMIRYRWESRIQSTINGLDRSAMAAIGERPWITSAEFLLNPQGRLVKAMIMKESGVKGFDAAATGAFREANIFPNPPQELVQEDGYIHLKYNFTVSYNPPPMVR